MPLRAVALAIFAFFLLACAGMDPATFTPTPPPGPEWVGVWDGPDAHVVITPDGMAQIETQSTNITAPVQEFGEGFIRVGIGPISQRWTVTPPWQADGKWQLVIDGHALTRTTEQASIQDDPVTTPRARVEINGQPVP